MTPSWAPPSARLGLAAGAGALFACAFQPVDLPALSILAVGAFIALAGSGTWRRGLVVGYAFGLGFFGPHLWWLWASIAPGAWLALTILEASWFAILGAAIAAVRSLPLAPFWVASLWTATEVLRSSWPLGGLPWGRLGLASLDTVWQGWLSWGGVSATSFVLALTAAVLADLAIARGRGARLRVIAALVLVATLIPTAAATLSPLQTDGTARIAVVQGGVPGTGNRLVEHHREVTDNQARETVALAARLRATGQPPPDLVLWPENATAVDPDSDPRAQAAIRESARAGQAPLLAGSITDGATAGVARNQGIVWSSRGVAGERYTKRHLVPFGEYVPWRAIARRVSERIAEIPRDMVPGLVGEPLQIGDLEVADALCFDVAYDDVIAPQVRRAAVVVTVQTSNATFFGTSQLEQQWDITRVRAIEAGRAVVVASVNGMSGAIGPSGQVLSRLPEGTTSSTVARVPLSRDLTPAVRLGPWPGRAVVCLAALGLLMAAASAVRRGLYYDR